MSEQPERLDKATIQAMFDQSPFIAMLGLEVLDLDYESTEITVRMPMSSAVERKSGTTQFHGGPLAAFIDVVGDFALGMMLGGGIPTINLRIDYLKPAFGEAVTAVARVRRHGRTIAVIDIDVSDEKGSLVAIGRGTYAPLIG